MGYVTAIPIKTVIDGKWFVRGRLGEGGVGQVYRVCAVDNHRNQYALKVLHETSPSDLARFSRERLILERISSRHVVKFFGAGKFEGNPYIVMELADGGSLRDLLEAKGSLPMQEAASIMLQMISGVRAAHAKSIIHRDLKPENVLIQSAGQVVKVADFGLSKTAMPGATVVSKTGIIAGTPWYMSPEQANNTKSVGPATDIYALGVIFHEMLTGRTIFSGDNAIAILSRQIKDLPDIEPTLDHKVRKFIASTQEKEPSRRIGLREMSEFLRGYSGSIVEEAEPQEGWLSGIFTSFHNLFRRRHG